MTRISSIVAVLMLCATAVYGREMSADRHLLSPMPSGWGLDSILEPAESPSGDNARWWAGFGDSLLDSLIALGRERNYDLASSATRIAIAKAQAGQARAAYMPAVGLSAGYSRERLSGRTGAEAVPQTTESYFSGSVTMSWEIDVFGKITRQVKERKAQVAVSAAEYESVGNAVDAQIASTYLGLLASREQLEVARRHSASQAQILRTTEERFAAGLASKLDVAQARTLYYSTVASIPMLEASIASSVETLGVLLGMDPSELPAGVHQARPLPDCMAMPALGVPADLLRRRPDVVQAERQIDVAAAALGVARGEYLPSLSLQGSVGTSAHAVGNLFGRGSFEYSIAPTLSWTVFDGLGRRFASAEAEASLRGAVDAYNLSVLTAMQEVRDAARRYDASLRYIRSIGLVVENAAESSALSFDLYRQGLTAFTNVDDAELNYLTYENTLVTARSQALTALVDLYKALGGGWTFRDQL